MKAKRRRERHAVGLEGEREPEPDEDDADILDGVIGEQPLEVVLHERVQHAHHGRDAGEREHHNAPPPSRRSGEIEDDPHEAIDGDFGHHAAHQAGDVTRRGRMRERQPDVQWHDAGLRAGAEQGEHQRQRSDRGGRMRGANLREGIVAVRTGEQAETPAAGTACRSSP